MKLDFVNPVARGTGVSSQAVPVSVLEVGLGQGLETVLQMPLLRISRPDGSSLLAAGQFSMAFRYLLAGSTTGKYAIAVGGRLEVPTGDSALVGNETQLMPTVLAEWRATPRLLFRSNIAWDTTVGGTTGRFAFLEHSNAVVWRAHRRLMPVAEFTGSTNTITGVTELVLQPEAIAALNVNLELKIGFSVYVKPAGYYAIRSEIAWFWGKRQ